VCGCVCGWVWVCVWVWTCCQSAESELKQLELDQIELEELRQQLASYFCEDVVTFRLDDCISMINTFTQQFIRAVDVRQSSSPTVQYSLSTGRCLVSSLSVVTSDLVSRAAISLSPIDRLRLDG